MFVPLGKIKDMIQLHETIMGKRLIEGTLPDIADQLKRIADTLEKKHPVEPNKIQQKHLERLLNTACEIISSLEHTADKDLRKNIDALFNEINYSDYLDSEMKDPDQEAQDWDTFGKNKI